MTPISNRYPPKTFGGGSDVLEGALAKFGEWRHWGGVKKKTQKKKGEKGKIREGIMTVMINEAKKEK